MNAPIVLNLNAAETAQLERACKMLHGADDWKRPSARDLGMNIRTFRRMAEGEAPIPVGVWRDLRRLLCTHAALCKQVAADLPTGDTP